MRPARPSAGTGASARWWRPLLAPLGFVAYMAYLWRHTGEPLAWRLTERGGWHSYPSLTYPFRIVWARSCPIRWPPP